MSPVKGSDLAKQIELARQNIERWPQWLKDAAGITGKESVEPVSGEETSAGRTPPSTADSVD
jgi:hypothetical protein